MTENTAKRSLRESLSALVDNQATELELHRILKESEGNAEIRSVWARYQLASAAMRGDTPGGDYVDLSDRIRSAINAEQPHDMAADQLEGEMSAAARPQRWWQQAGRFAIAASVAGAVIIGVQQSSQLLAGGQPGGAEVAAAGPTQDQIPALNPALSVRSVSTDAGQNRASAPPMVIFVPKQRDQAVPVEAVQKRLNHLMLEHAEHAAQNSGRGMLPFARIPRMEEE